MRNWQIAADDYISRQIPGWENYRRLRDMRLYDVEVDLRFHWRDHILRGRDVDPDGYTTDYVSGQTRPRGPAQQPVQDGGVPLPPAPGASPTNPIDQFVSDHVARLRERAEQWARERLSELTPPGGASTDGGPGQAVPVTGGGSHSVHLATRWHRSEGRVTTDHATDVIRYVLDGPSEATGYTVSATLPAGAFDMETPPSWPGPNPKPPPRVRNFNFRP